MNVIFAGGGTAGHVNPAIAAANYIKKQEPSTVYLAGGSGNIEEKLAKSQGIEIFTFPLKGLSRSVSLKGVKQNITALKNSRDAIQGCTQIIKRIKPDVVVGTGGYASYPMVRAAVKCHVPTAILEVNATPGVTTKRLAKMVDCVMISFSDTQRLIPGAKKIVLTGSPVREEIINCREKRYEPLFNNGLPTVVSFWGSVGAFYMNKKMEGFIKLAAEKKQFNHIHAAGAANYKWMPDEIKEMGCDLSKADNIDLREYIYDMDRVMACADLVICRAGGTLAELCAAGRPSIIVSSPFVAENHQEKNARILEKVGAAVVITESEATPQLLYDTALKLLGDKKKLEDMSKAALSKAQPKALEKIYQTIRAIV